MIDQHRDRFDVARFNVRPPHVLPALIAAAEAIGFDMRCTCGTGQLLRLLASLKPGGHLLEIGTGTGVGTAWLLDGMHPDATLTTIEQDPTVLEVARAHLDDSRLSFVTGDAGQYVATAERASCDLIFADAVPGKYELVEETLALLRPGGIYVVDDMLPQQDWPSDHYPFAAAMIDRLATLVAKDSTIVSVGLNWDTGLVLLTKTGSHGG